jgi:hypothetical protein
LAVFVLVAMFGGNVRGQQTAGQAPAAQGTTPKIAIQVKAVSVLTTVRDKHGKIVTNLAKEDFAVTEDGRPQTISYFLRERRALAAGIAGGY